MDGSLFANYVANLVEQINKGALPNIDDSYTYICKAKCNQVKTTAEQDFDLHFMQALKLPCAESTLNAAYEQALKAAKDYYDEYAIGEEKLKNTTKQELEKLLQEKRDTKVELNNSSTKSVIVKFIEDQYKPLERKLLLKEIKTIPALEQEFNNFIGTLQNNGLVGAETIKT